MTLMQAEYLFGYYERYDDQNLKEGDIDWTFIFVLLAKSVENLLANFVTLCIRRIQEKEDLNIKINKYGKIKQINLDDPEWRVGLSVKDIQQIITKYIIPKYKHFYDMGRLNESINSMFRDNRNKYLHHEVMLDYRELLNHFEGIYQLIYLIINYIE